MIAFSNTLPRLRIWHMADTQGSFDIYLETGAKRTFAGALYWPGWCRSGRDAESAVQALFDYGPRYARAMQTGRIDFNLPAAPSDFHISERLQGGASIDFGVPETAPALDAQPLSSSELDRLQSILRSCWLAFDEITQSAAGKELRVGPRGGGRQLEKMVWHVIGAESHYLSQLGGKLKIDEGADPASEYERVRQAVLDTLPRSAQGELPTQGPRGGLRWTPRYFVRRAAWHVLDHAWEIEDRLIDQ
jgi:hypothetical protein